MAQIWKPVESAAKNDAGQYLALVDGKWNPVAGAAKNGAGQYMALMDDTPEPPAGPSVMDGRDGQPGGDSVPLDSVLNDATRQAINQNVDAAYAEAGKPKAEPAPAYNPAGKSIQENLAHAEQLRMQNESERARELEAGQQKFNDAVTGDQPFNPVEERANTLDAASKVKSEGYSTNLYDNLNALFGKGIIAGAAGAVGGAVRGNDTSKADTLLEEAAQKAIDFANDYQKQAQFEGVNPTVSSAGQSIGYSAATMLPMAIPYVGQGISFGMMYRGAQNQFMNQIRDSYEKQHGKVSDSTWAKKENEVSQESKNYGLWEAIPEYASDRLFFGILGKTFGAKTMGGVTKRLGAAYGLEFLNESGSEAATNLGQNIQTFDANKKLGIEQSGTRGDYANIGDWIENYKAVAPSVALSTAIMSGAGGAIRIAAGKDARAAETARPLSLQAAELSAKQKTETTGQEHEVVPHPVAQGKFAAIPKNTATIEQAADIAAAAPVTSSQNTAEDILAMGDVPMTPKERALADLDQIIQAGKDNARAILTPRPQTPPAAATPAEAAPNVLEAPKGAAHEIHLPSGGSLPAQWDVVDADSVTASLKEGVAQPRDRSRAASDVQVQSIANNPRYELTSDSPMMDLGAPTVSKEGHIVGGNGRFEGISRAYDQGTAGDYRAKLKADAARKGIDPAVIDSMKKPVLVRRITQDFDPRSLAIQSNSGSSLQYSGLELAKIDAERMGDLGDIAIADNGDIAMAGANVDAIKRATRAYGAAELGAFTDASGQLSQEGARRVRNAILFQAYDNTPALTRLVESNDSDLRTISGALLRSASTVAAARSDMKDGKVPAELDILPDLVAAIESLSKIKADGASVKEFLAQQGMFGEISQEAKDLLQYLDDNIRSQKRIAELIKAYYDDVAHVDLSTEDIFGERQLPAKQEVMNHAKQTIGATTETADLFSNKQPGAEGGKELGSQGAPAQRTEESKPEGSVTTLEHDAKLFHGTRYGNKFASFDVTQHKNKGVGSNVFNQGHHAYLTQSREAAQWFADKATENAELRAGKTPTDQAGEVLEFTLKKGAKVLRVENMPQMGKADTLIERAKADGVDAIMFRDPAFDTVEGSKRVADMLNSGKPMDTVLVLNHDMLEESSTAQAGNVKPFAEFATEYANKLPADTYENKRQIDELTNEIINDWSNGNSSREVGIFGPDEIHAALHDENEARYYDSDGDLTDEGGKRYNELEYKLANDAARKYIGAPKRQEFDLSHPVNAAKVLHAYLDAKGLDVSAISGSGKSQSKYFEIMRKGGNIKVRISDHEIPAEYETADEDLRLYDVSPDGVRADGRNDSVGIDSEEAMARAKEFADYLVSKYKNAASSINSNLVGVPAGGTQERSAVRAEASGSLTELAQKGEASGKDNVAQQATKSKKLEVLKAQAKGQIDGHQGAALKELADAGEHAAVDEVLKPTMRDATTQERIASEKAAPVNDLHDKPTGWKRVEGSNNDSVTLVSYDGKKAVPFVTADKRSGTASVRMNAEAHAYAIDNPYQGKLPEGELVTKPVFADKELSKVSQKFWKGETFKEIAPKVVASRDVYTKKEPKLTGTTLGVDPTEFDYYLTDGRASQKISKEVYDYIESLKHVNPIDTSAKPVEKSAENEHIAQSDSAEISPLNTEQAAKEVIAEADAIEPASAIKTELTNRMQAMIADKQESKIGDFGRKVMVRKDEAQPTGPRNRMQKAEDERPAWARKYVVMQISKTPLTPESKVGKWQIMKLADGQRSGQVSPVSRETFDTEQEALNAIPLAVVSQKHRVYSYETKAPSAGEKLWGIYRNITDRKRAMVKGGFNTQLEAMQYMVEHPTEIIEHKFGEPERPWLDHIERIGESRRTKDVTKQMFEHTFAPGGVVYGNWLLNKDGTVNADGQALSNYAYDALLDLSEIIGVPPKALFLEGELALGLGADGKGGKKSASAHYAPDKGLINLTKINGAGTVAHELWHAMDHYFAKSSGYNSDSAITNGYAPSRTTARPELIEAMKRVKEAMLYAERSTTTDADMVRQRSQKRIDEAVKSLDYHLRDLRGNLTDGRYNKGNKIATAAQLKQWDDMAAKLHEGDMGDDVYIANPSKMRGALGFTTGETLRDMNALYKSVAGRSFLRQDQESVGRRMHWIVKSIADNKANMAVKEDVTTTTKGRSDYYIEAKRIDGYRVGDYWSTPEEMGARAFESYIFDKLTEKQQRSDYLVYAVENRYYAASDMKPYPEGEDRARIDAAFDNLFQTIESKETDKGVALFSRAQSQTETPEFKRWFGDSKVVDADGKPLVVYHSTSAEEDFSKFRRRVGDIGMHFGTVGQAEDRWQYTNKIGGDYKNPRIMPVYMAIKRPLRMNDAGAWNAENLKSQLLDLFPHDAARIGSRWGKDGLKTTKDIREFIQSKGYDGVVYKNTGETAGADEYRRAVQVAKIGLPAELRGKSSYSAEDQKHPAYIKYRQAEEAYSRFREDAAEDSYIAFDPSQVKSAIGNNGQFDPKNPDIRFSARQSGRGLPVSTVESIANPIAEKLKNVRTVKVVARQSGIPGLKEKIDAAFSRFEQDRTQENLDKYLAVAKDNIEGAYVNGELYLVASNLGSADRVTEVLRHEVAHLSVEQMLEQAQPGLYQKLLNQVKILDAGGNPYIRKLAAAVDKSQPGLDKNTRAAEIIAQIAERNDHEKDMTPAVRSLWQRISDGIKAFYKLVFGDNLTDQDVRDIVAQSFRWARGEGETEARVIGGSETALHSRNEKVASVVRQAWQKLSARDSMFRFPRNNEQTMEGNVLAAMNGLDEDGKPFTQKSAIKSIDVAWEMEGKHDVVKAWEVTSGFNDKPAYIYQNKEGRVWLDVSNFKSGTSGGAALYTGVLDYCAKNKGLKLVGDPNGVTDTAMLRRTELMLSAAIKHGGRTDFMEPAMEQQSPLLYKGKLGHNDWFLEEFAPVKWGKDDAQNVDNLIESAQANIALLVPEVKNVHYDFTTGELEISLSDEDRQRIRTSDERVSVQSKLGTALIHQAIDRGIERAKRIGIAPDMAQGSPYGASSIVRAGLAGSIASEIAGGRRGDELLSSLDGELSPALRGALYSRSSTRESSPKQFSLPEETALRAAQRNIQDHQVRWDVVQNAIKEQGGHIDETNDVFLALKLYSGRVAAAFEAFQRKTLEPILERAAKAKIPLEDVAEYLYAQHAKERNAQIAKINQNMPDGGSGMSNAESDQVLAELAKRKDFYTLKGIAKDLQGITDSTLNILVRFGVFSKEHADAYRNTYQNYVPLKGFEAIDEAGKPTGTGMGHSTPSKLGKRALGRKSRAGQIIENIVRDHEAAILAAEKANIGRRVRKFVEDNPDDKLWTVEQAPLSPMFVKGNANNPDGMVALRRDVFDPDKEIRFIEGDKEVRIQLHDPLLVRAYNKLGLEKLEGLVAVSATITSFLRQMYTQKNPAFFLINPIRDIQDMGISLTGYAGGSVAAKAFKHWPGAWLAMIRYSEQEKSTSTFVGRNTVGEDAKAWQPWIDKFKSNGGAVGFAWVGDIQQKQERIDHLMERLGGEGVLDALRQGKIKSGVKRMLFRTLNNEIFDVIEHLNYGFENASRLAAFRAAVESGISPREAGRIAKQVTTNFNDKGEKGGGLNALYLFANASIQGTANIARVLAGRQSKRKLQVYALIGTIIAMGLLAGFDDDDEDKDVVPDYDKRRNWNIDLGNNQRLTIPKPYGWAFFHDIGRAMAHVYQDHSGDSVLRQSLATASSFMENLSPINPIPNNDLNLKDAVQAITPTVGKPFVQVATNRTAFGSPVMPEDENKTGQPDSMKEWRRTRGTLYEALAQGMNKATGGDPVQAGSVDISPETLKLMFSFLTGGAGRFATDTVSSAFELSGTGDTKPENAPIVRQFYKHDDVDSYMRRFFSQADEVKNLRDSRTGYRKLQSDEGDAGVDRINSNPLTSLPVDSARKQLARLRDEQDEIRANKAMPADQQKKALKASEAGEMELLKDFNAEYKAAKKAGLSDVGAR